MVYSLMGISRGGVRCCYFTWLYALIKFGCGYACVIALVLSEFNFVGCFVHEWFDRKNMQTVVYERGIDFLFCCKG